MHPAIQPFDFIERDPHLFTAQCGVGQEIDEVLNRLFEVDVVFPEGVVTVDDQDGLVRHWAV